MTPNVVNYGRHPPDLPLSLGQERSSGECFLGLQAGCLEQSPCYYKAYRQSCRIPTYT